MAAEVSIEALGQVAEYFKVLSEISRLRILCALKSGAKNVTEIIAMTNLGQANVSKHLKTLTQVGMIKREPRGVSVYYEIADASIFEICEIVCASLSVNIEAQSQQLEQLHVFR